MSQGPAATERRPGGIKRYVPILAWLPGYRRTGSFRADVVAGISVAALLIPESLGYAEIAGLPPEVGLYAAPAALIGYAIFGGSRLLVVATASAVSAVSAGIIGGLAAGDEEAAIALSAALAIVAGVLFLAGGLARMGWVSNFMSKAVMEGFIVGLSISIIIGQLGALVGVEVEGDNAIAELVDLFSKLASWDGLTVVFGLGSLAALFAMERFVPRLPGALTVVVVGIVLVSVFDLDLFVVGEIPRGLPDFGIPDIDGSQWIALIPGGFAIVLVGFSEGFAAAKDAADPREPVEANQELIGYGASNVGAGFSGGMVVSGSLSKTAANKEAGATTQVANIVNALIVLLTLAVLAPLFTNLPEATLAGIVIHAVWRSADPRRLLPYRKVLPIEFWVALVVLATVLLIGEIQGVILGVIISLGAVIYRISFPRTAELGREEATGRMVALDTHPSAVPVPGVVVYRFDAPLIYPNTGTFGSDVRRYIEAHEEPVERVVIDCEAISDIDATGAESLVRLVSILRGEGIEAVIVRMHRTVYEALERGGAIDEIGPDSFLQRPEDALPSDE